MGQCGTTFLVTSLDFSILDCSVTLFFLLNVGFVDLLSLFPGRVCARLRRLFMLSLLLVGNQLLKNNKCSFIYMMNLPNLIGPILWAMTCKLYSMHGL